jgi:hypothetical protein
MSKIDFDKTPTQVHDEIQAGLEKLSHDLHTSRGHGDRGKGALFTVISVLVVFVVNSILTFISTPSATVVTPPIAAVSGQSNLSSKDSRIAESLILRIEKNISDLALVKARVAPNMPVEGQIDAIRTAASDLRGVLGVPAKD